MKIKLFNVFLLIIITIYTLSAQSQMDQGVIVFEITDIASDDEMMLAQLQMLKGTETAIYFNKEKSKVSSNMMGGLMVMNVLTDYNKNTSDMYMDMMGNKILVNSQLDEMKKMQQQQTKDANVEIEKTNETKNILGYDCVKYLIKTDTDTKATMECYVTDRISAAKDLVQGFQNVEIPGFPLEYVMHMEGMSMTMTTTKLEETVSKSDFSVDPTGYRKMTMDEFMKEMGGMAGGLGF